MIKWLNFFSIQQKLLMLLSFLLSTVSYLAISTMSVTNQHKKSNITIEIAQQQHLIVEKFVNAFFYARQQETIKGKRVDTSEIKKNQFLFEQNIKVMLYGGRTYLDLTMKNSIYLDAISNNHARAEVKISQTLWQNLQSASQNFPLQSATLEQLSIFHHLSNKLHKKLSTIVTNLTQHRDAIAQKERLILQLSWLSILILSSLFTWLIVQNITQPINNIAKIASRIRLGDLKSYPENNPHHDELGTLFYQTDEMRLVLSEMMLSIQQHNKQIVHSSMQATLLSDEISALHHLQYNKHSQLVMLIGNLQTQNLEQLKRLNQHADFNIINQKILDNDKNSLQLAVDNIKIIEQQNNQNSKNITFVKQYAEQLYDVLENIEGIAIKTEGLAKKATIDATHAGKRSEQFTLVANQVSHLSAKTANNITAVSPILKQFRGQLNLLSSSISKMDTHLSNSLKQCLHSTLHIESISEKMVLQQQHSLSLTRQNKQQALQIQNVHSALEKTFALIKESTEKIEASNLFVKDIKNISGKLEQLSYNFKLDDKEDRTRRGNDKRVRPRINNYLKVSLQQAKHTLQGVTQDLSLSGLQLKSMKSVAFNYHVPITISISLPTADMDSEIDTLNLQGNIVHFEQQDDINYYGLCFHPFNEQDQTMLQVIFDYFDKRSQFKN